MTTNISSSDKFLGHPVTKLRAILRSWAKGTRSPDDLGYLAAIKLSPGATTAFLAECVERGLVTVAVDPEIPENIPDRERFADGVLSDAGFAITGASAKKRSDKKAAAKVLAKVLENATKLSADDKAVTKIERIWVFGSFIDEARPDVGDLDIVIESRRTPVGESMGLFDRNKYLETAYPGMIPQTAHYLMKEGIWFSKMLYGERKHHLIAETDLGTLKGLYRPCQLVFDREKGGTIEPIYFDHHPESVGRSNSINPRLEMPDLSPNRGDFHFIDAKVLTKFWSDKQPSQQLVIRSNDKLPKNYAKLLKDIPLDGRKHFAVAVLKEGKPQAVFHVERNVSLGGGQWSYDMNVSCLYAARNAEFDLWGRWVGANLLSNLYNGDLVRLADRRATFGGYQSICGYIDLCKRTETVPGLVDGLSHMIENGFDNEEYSNLPFEQRFGFEMFAPNGNGRFHSELHEYEASDWEGSQITREAYATWLRANDPATLELLTDDKSEPATPGL
jgi:predicted nucleotidyltransferase